MKLTVVSLLLLAVGLVLCKEPVCPRGAPFQKLADDERCDRFWECEDEIISDRFCPEGEGFNKKTKTCDRQTKCTERGSNSGSGTGNNKDLGGGLMPLLFRTFIKGFSSSSTSSGSDDSRSDATGFLGNAASFFSPILRLFKLN